MASKDGRLIQTQGTKLSQSNWQTRSTAVQDQPSHAVPQNSRFSGAVNNNDTIERDENGGSGCFICGLDNDHDKLLLCEICNGEYHTYCLVPPLEKIPENEWYCGTPP